MDVCVHYIARHSPPARLPASHSQVDLLEVLFHCSKGDAGRALPSTPFDAALRKAAARPPADLLACLRAALTAHNRRLGAAAT